MPPQSMLSQSAISPFQSSSTLIALLLGLTWNVAGFPLAALAQLSSPPTAVPQSVQRENRTLSLTDAIQVAEENNQDLKIALLRVQQAEEGVKVAKSAKLPTISAAGSVFRTDGATFNANPGGVVNPAEQARIQQQTSANAQQQRQLARNQFQQQLRRLQVQLQRDTDLSQQDNVNQQITELTQRANASAQTPPVNVVPPSQPFQGFAPSTRARLDDSISNTIQSNVGINYTILTGGQRSALIREQEKRLEASKLDVLRIKQQLRLNVANDYYDLQEVRALLTVALSAVTNAEQTLNNTILTEQAGLSTKFEILQAEVQLANAKQNLNLAEGLQVTAQRQLAETLSLGPNVMIVPSDGVDPNGEWVTSLPQSIVVAQKNRVELQQLLLSREIQKERQTQVKAVKRPNLSSFARLSASASDVEPGGNPLNPSADNFRGNLGYDVGLQVNMNVFDGGQLKAQLQEIKENIKQIETQYDDQKLAIRLAVERGYSALKQNRENIGTAQGALTLAKESLELARLRLKAGIGTQLDVIQAETDLTQAEGNVISAILDYNRAIASLARETSYLLPIEDYRRSR